MIAVGKKSGRFIIGSGRGVNPGRIAGGAPGIANYSGSDVFGTSVYSSLAGHAPGGLIDKKQQADPSSTVFAHPFDNGKYRSTSTLPKQHPLTAWNVTTVLNPIRQQVPEIMPHERGSFFRRKLTPAVKTQFGGNKTGLKSDTAFHPQRIRFMPPPAVRSSYDTAKIQNRVKPPSFDTTGNLWGSGNHSYIEGHINPVDGRLGVGRWATRKRSVV